MRPDLSLILPCFNEAPHIDQSIQKIVSVLNNSKFSFEIILIDDASSDGTKHHIKRLSKKYKSIRYSLHRKNVGRGRTVQEGIIKARGDVVGFIDIDLEVGPDYIPHFVELITDGKCDVVVGSRYYPPQLFPLGYLLRTIVSIGSSLLIKIVFQLPVKDTQTGYKFFKRERILQVLRNMQDKHWFWDTEIIVRAYLLGLKIQEEPVLFLRSKDKKSTVKIIPDAIASLKSLWSLKFLLLKQSASLGLLYLFPNLYTFTMRLLYGKAYESRYRKIADQIPPKSSVVDVCCGDCVLYDYLKTKNINYLGLDISPAFIWHALKGGLPASLFDLRTDDVPKADYIVLQGSLYQFKNPKKILKKLYSASQNSLIIAETIQTLAKNPIFANTFLKTIGSFVVNTENKETFRFDCLSFKKLLSSYRPDYIEKEKEIIAVIKKSKLTSSLNTIKSQTA